MTDSVVRIVTEDALLLNSTLETLCVFRNEMDRLSSMLHEYEAVMELYGIGKILGSQLIQKSVISDVLTALNPLWHWPVLTHHPINRDKLTRSREAFPSVALRHLVKRFFRL